MSSRATRGNAPARVVRLPEKNLDALAYRAEQTKKAPMNLSPEDCDLWSNAELTLASMQEQLIHNELTISKL